MDRPYWTVNRQKLFEWISMNGSKSFAELYKGAVICLHEKIPGHVRFVCHAARDLMNGMPSQKLGLERQQVQYVQLVKELKLSWDDSGLKLPGSKPMGDESVTESPEVVSQTFISPKVVKKIESLFIEHEKGRQRQNESPFRFFEAFMPHSAVMEQAAIEFAATWQQLHKWFKAGAHQGEEPPSVECLNQIDDRFKQLENIILAVADRPSNTIERIDEILGEANK